MNTARTPRPPRAARLLVALGVFLCAAPAPSKTDDEHLPVRVRVEVDDARLPETGIFHLRLVFSPEDAIARPHFVRVVVGLGPRELVVRDHVPDPPLVKWRPGERVEYELPCAFPLEIDLPAVDFAEIRLGFVDAETGRVRAPLDTDPYSSGLARVARLRIPRFAPIAAEEEFDARLALARDLAREDEDGAWNVLELALRLCDEDDWKERARDAMLALGTRDARPPSLREHQIVRRRIEDERARYLRLVAGRMFDKGRLHGALLLLREVGGVLEERAGEAVLGALDEAKRQKRRIDEIEQRIVDAASAEERAEAESLEARFGLTRRLLEKAKRLRRRGGLGTAHLLLLRLRLADDEAVREEAKGLLADVERERLEAVPRDERREVEEALHHPCWARTSVRPSREFLFIGPRRLLDGIPADSLLAFDLAYVFLTDLFGRVPNPQGDRVTVYFKELWDFGGGVGGGTTIDIGRADPGARKVRVDTPLLFHELTHCIDDTSPVFRGMREGLANVGAVYALEALGRVREARRAFQENLRDFQNDYLARDLEYWRIQNYGPSAGLFLHFLERFSKRGEIHDWRPYRRFFRGLRRTPDKDPREAAIARTLAFHFVRAFGDEAFADLMRFRWPLVPEDLEAIGLEQEAFDRFDFSDFADAWDRFRNSPLPRDLQNRRLLELARDDERAALDYARSRLGILLDWRVIGPFSVPGQAPGPMVFPPEREIDFGATYPVRNNTAAWSPPADHPPVTLLPIGWVRIDYPYQDHTSSFAVTSVEVPRAVPARLWLRADDAVTAYLDGERVGRYRGRGRYGTRVPWRGPWLDVPDAIGFAVNLSAGRHRLLLEIENETGAAGFSCALSDEAGRPIEGLVADASWAEEKRHDAPEPRWKKRWRRDFSSGGARGIDVRVGRFAVRTGALRGLSTDRGVQWRKYTVRPGFPKDSPSNLCWLDEGVTEGLGDFRLTVDLEGDEAPKLAVIFQGDGARDALCGWTLLLAPAGAQRVRARLERYDRLVYATAPEELPTPSVDRSRRRLVLELSHRRCSVRLDDAVLFDRVPIRPIAGIGPNGARGGAAAPHRIGLATWGPEPGIAAMRLEAAEAGR